MRIGLLGALLCGLAMSAPAHSEDAHVAMLKNVKGNVKIMRDNAEIVARPGMQLMKMDTVVAAPASSAGVVFVDGTVLAVGASSELEISRYVFRPEESKYDFAVLLKKGQAVYSSGKLGKLAPDAVNVNTPRATVGVRGTRFIVKSDD
jgi:hypothetical protein